MTILPSQAELIQRKTELLNEMQQKLENLICSLERCEHYFAEAKNEQDQAYWQQAVETMETRIETQQAIVNGIEDWLIDYIAKGWVST